LGFYFSRRRDDKNKQKPKVKERKEPQRKRLTQPQRGPHKAQGTCFRDILTRSLRLAAYINFHSGFFSPLCLRVQLCNLLFAVS
jgi:hypothetical protein